MQKKCAIVLDLDDQEDGCHTAELFPDHERVEVYREPADYEAARKRQPSHGRNEHGHYIAAA